MRKPPTNDEVSLWEAIIKIGVKGLLHFRVDEGMPHADALQLRMIPLAKVVEIALGKMTAQTAVLLEDANGGAAVVVLHALAQRLLQLLLVGTTVGGRRGGSGMEAVVPAEHLAHECL